MTKSHSHWYHSAYLNMYTFQFSFFMMTWFINLLLTYVLISKSNISSIANIKQNILFTMLSMTLHTYCWFTSGIEIGYCIFCCDRIRQFLCIKYVSDIFSDFVKRIQNHKNETSPVFSTNITTFMLLLSGTYMLNW